VVANGTGTIAAGGNIGAPISILNVDQSKGFALSLIKGGWEVYAPMAVFMFKMCEILTGFLGREMLPAQSKIMPGIII